MVATPALAQAVMSEPGYCAQFYPNANCHGETPAVSPKRPPRRRSNS
jgi:hypothetical protein